MAVLVSVIILLIEIPDGYYLIDLVVVTVLHNSFVVVVGIDYLMLIVVMMIMLMMLVMVLEMVMVMMMKMIEN